MLTISYINNLMLIKSISSMKLEPLLHSITATISIPTHYGTPIVHFNELQEYHPHLVQLQMAQHW